MSNRYYRIISRETFDRAPLGGIKGTRESQRSNLDGSQFIVERAAEFRANDRWFDEVEALAVVTGPDWCDPNPFPQIPETDGEN
jgi:hypothetical protein